MELNGNAEQLLIIDIVEHETEVQSWLPREALSGCRTLITSRFADWLEETGIKSIPIYVLDQEPSRDFLSKRRKRDAIGDALAACDKLAGMLAYLPLALA